MWIDGPWALLAYEYRAEKVAKKKRLKKGARQARRRVGSPGLGSPDSESYSAMPEGRAIPSLPSAPSVRSQHSKGGGSLP